MILQNKLPFFHSRLFLRKIRPNINNGAILYHTTKRWTPVPPNPGTQSSNCIKFFFSFANRHFWEPIWSIYIATVIVTPTLLWYGNWEGVHLRKYILCTASRLLIHSLYKRSSTKNEVYTSWNVSDLATLPFLNTELLHMYSVDTSLKELLTNLRLSS